jgi:hypothetical protein
LQGGERVFTRHCDVARVGYVHGTELSDWEQTPPTHMAEGARSTPILLHSPSPSTPRSILILLHSHPLPLHPPTPHPRACRSLRTADAVGGCREEAGAVGSERPSLTAHLCIAPHIRIRSICSTAEPTGIRVSVTEVHSGATSLLASSAAAHFSAH